jgi:hypothetical protein
MEPRLSFADEVYDVVLCNLGLAEVADRQRAITEFARVTKPGGEVRCSLPIEGTFQEFYDIYREVLTKHDKHETLARLGEHVASAYPTAAECESWLKVAGLSEVRVDIESFSMLFRSSREFFFAPVIEFGPLAEWKRVAGRGQEMQDVFWYIKEAIDAYFEGRAFEVTVKAACLSGRKPSIEDVEDATPTLKILDDIAELIAATPPGGIPAPSSSGGVTATEEIDLDAMVQIPDGAIPLVVEEMEAAEIDALAEGAMRPSHLETPELPAGDEPGGRREE